MGISLKAIVSKLNDTTRTALEGAAGLCLARTHYDVEIEHFLMKLLDTTDSDFAKIVKQFGVDKSRLSGELSRALDKLKTGNARTPSFSPSLVTMLTEAWTLGSLEFGGTQVRTGFTVLALVSHEDLSRIVREIGKELQKIEPESLRKQLPAILADSLEYVAEPVAAAGPAGTPGAVKPGGKTPNLDQYTVNLTENARKGKIDPVLGRDFEIRQIVDILTRRRQNNPILTGEAGVGKTAVVEGFAYRIVQGDVPPVLRNVTIRTLDLALLQAGAQALSLAENPLASVRMDNFFLGGLIGYAIEKKYPKVAARLPANYLTETTTALGKIPADYLGHSNRLFIEISCICDAVSPVLLQPGSQITRAGQECPVCWTAVSANPRLCCPTCDVTYRVPPEPRFPAQR